MKFSSVLFVCVSSLAVAPVSSCSHDPSHSHESASVAPVADTAEELEPATHTVFGARALLFMEHPPLVVGQAARFLAHFSVLATGEPVRAGRVRLEIGSIVLGVDAPKRDGLFTPEGLPGDGGEFPARIVIESEQVVETLELGMLRVHASEAAARDAAAGDPELANAVPFLMEQQWRVKLLLAEAAPRALERRLLVPAATRAPEGASVAVAPPLAGRLVAPPTGRLPRTGERVAAGQVLAFVESPLAPAEVAALQAATLELELRALELERTLGEARARLGLAERERERIVTLRDEGLRTQPDLEHAELALALARADVTAAVASQAATERLRAERGASGGGGRLAVRAPIGGIVTAVGHAEGEYVAPDAELFRVLDATRLVFEGRVSEFDAALVAEVPSARITIPALPGHSLQVPDAARATAYVASEIDPETRTFVLRYELENPGGTLKAGMLARLELATERRSAAVVIPFEAVISEQGQPTAYVMASGETFQRRDLELGLRDGDFVEVVSGIVAGERVATRGAYLVKLAALSPASFGHGHAH